MAISVAEIQSRLQPFLLVHLKPEVQDLLLDSDYLRIMNDTAHDLNEEGNLLLERWNNTGSTDLFEDSGVTNLLVAGVIHKILYFKYEDEDWEDQRYSHIDDRLVLKDSANEVDMDIWYLRRCEEVAETTDEIDLPAETLTDYMELLKTRVRIDYGDLTHVDYQDALRFYGAKASTKIPKHAMQNVGIMRHWFYQNDDAQYNITKQWVSIGNFVADVSGNYTYTE